MKLTTPTYSKFNPDLIEYVPTALKIAYFGKKYYGLQMQGTVPTIDAVQPILNPPTIESTLVKVLMDLCFIHPLKWKENFSKCGRTDKGVSSFGNVIVMNMRNIENPLVAINTRLPNDIKVIAFQKVSSDFSARFNCTSRTYRYYFVKSDGMCINKMKRASKHLLGTHDFRNFCKLDPKITMYTRRIDEIIFSKFTQYNNDEVWVVEIKGSAFLWHQIRFTMALLFLVGKGFEEEDISWLLDIEVSKPNFDMASEVGLVLYDTEHDIDWIWDKSITLQPTALKETIVEDCLITKPVEKGRPNLHDVAQYAKQQLLIELALVEAFIQKYDLSLNRSHWGTTGGLAGQSGQLSAINSGIGKQLPSVVYRSLRKR